MHAMLRSSCPEGLGSFRPAPLGRPQVLQVRSCLAGSHASEQLQPGDLVLAVGGTPLSSFPALDDLLDGLSAAAASGLPAGDLPACPQVPRTPRCAAEWGVLSDILCMSVLTCNLTCSPFPLALDRHFADANLAASASMVAVVDTCAASELNRWLKRE